MGNARPFGCAGKPVFWLFRTDRTARDYMINKERSRYVAYQSMQALIFQLIWWVGGGALTGIAWAITGALSAVIIGLLCIPFACVISAMPLVALIYGVYAGIQCVIRDRILNTG